MSTENSSIFRLESAVAVVTGAGRGNGAAIAAGLVQAGARVLGVDLNFIEPTTSFEKIKGDVASTELVSGLVDRLFSMEYKHLVLVNNAGVTFPQEGYYPQDCWNKTIEINLTAPFLWMNGFSELFSKIGSGSIINITSLAAERAFPNNPAYIASKGGLKMLSKYYAKALGPYGVRVNNVGPGYIITDMTRSSYADGTIRSTRERHTFLARWGKPDDLVGICVFLASPASAYITGQDIYVDGGWVANGLVQ